MIKQSELTSIGTFVKPHGIKGELSAETDLDSQEISALKCVVLDMDGIYVPFFVDTVRDKSATTVLLKLDGVDSETEAKEYAGKEIYTPTSMTPRLMCCSLSKALTAGRSICPSLMNFSLTSILTA